MHRNTYIVVSVLAVAAALVVGVNVGKRIGLSPAIVPTPTPTPTPTPVNSLQTYTNAICGFSLRYPATFSLMENASGSAILNASGNQNQSVVMTCQKSIPRPSLPADKIEPFFVETASGASVSAKLYHDQSAKDGTPIDALIFTNPVNKLDVFIAGFGEGFNALIKTILITR